MRSLFPISSEPKHMNYKHLLIISIFTLAILALVFVVSRNDGLMNVNGGDGDASLGASQQDRRSRRRSEISHNVSSMAYGSVMETRSLVVPVREFYGFDTDDADDSMALREPGVSISDDEILVRGLVSQRVTEVSNSEGRSRSIRSTEWNGAANLLVNALRAGDRLEVNHDELMEFLLGKDLLGWPESFRNWIGDELMTALRQDMPGKAFESLKSIESDTMAPAAMRDYSVQHISHLVTCGVIGQEGAEYIWQTLAENDPQTLGTALISLHRLSEQVPELVSQNKVHEAAQRLKESSDERTRLSVMAILKEAEGK